MDFESTLAKARKLAALADPASNATDGERAAAQIAFAAYCTRWNITPEALDESRREWRPCLAISPHRSHKPKKDTQMLALCLNVALYVLGDRDRPRKIEVIDHFVPQRGLKPDKLYRVFELSLQVTERRTAATARNRPMKTLPTQSSGCAAGAGSDSRRTLIHQISAHLDGKPELYRKAFEKALAGGGEWDPQTNTFRWFGRVIQITSEGQFDEL